MAKKSKRLAAIAAASVISVTGISGLLALTGCNNVDLKTGYRTYTSVRSNNAPDGLIFWGLNGNS